MSILPEKPSKPVTDWTQLLIGIYGDPKIGKSTFLSQRPGMLILDTENGLQSLECYRSQIDSWPRMLEVCNEIAAGDHRFKAIGIDTIDNLYDYCLTHVCADASISHPSDLNYGKGWAMVQKEFKRVLLKLTMLPYGLMWVSHAKQEEKETRTGKQTKTVLTIPGSCRRLVLGMSDIVLFADMETVGDDKSRETRRVLRTKPTKAYEAGDRTGKLPETLPLGWDAFAEAFKVGGKK